MDQIQEMEYKVKHNEEYVEKVLYEQNEFKLKAHNAGLEVTKYKHEVMKLEQTLQSLKDEKMQQL